MSLQTKGRWEIHRQMDRRRDKYEYIWTDTGGYRDREQGDLISILLKLFIKESRLKLATGLYPKPGDVSPPQWTPYLFSN
jgi:hypothetical protein